MKQRVSKYLSFKVLDCGENNIFFPKLLLKLFTGFQKWNYHIWKAWHMIIMIWILEEVIHWYKVSSTEGGDLVFPIYEDLPIVVSSCCSSDLAKGKEILTLQRECHARRLGVLFSMGIVKVSIMQLSGWSWTLGA